MRGRERKSEVGLKIPPCFRTMVQTSRSECQRHKRRRPDVATTNIRALKAVNGEVGLKIPPCFRTMVQTSKRGLEAVHLIGAGILSLPPRLSGADPLNKKFHDIKPLPSFLPIPWGWIGAFLLALLLAVFFARRLARGRSKSRTPTPLPPDEEAMLALRRLDEEGLSGAKLGEALAEILRTFYRRAIGIRADEQTFLELERAVGVVVQRNLPLVPKELREQEGRRLGAALRSVERLEFAPDGGAVEGARAREVVKEHISTLALWIKSEGARTQSVTESSPSVFPLLREVS